MASTPTSEISAVKLQENPMQTLESEELLDSDASTDSEEKTADIRQLIEESKTDSENESDGEQIATTGSSGSIGEENESIQFDASESHLYKKTRHRSSELLRQPFQYKPRYSKTGRKRSIKFDDIAVLLDAAAEGDLIEVKRLIEEAHAEVNMCNEKGVTALHRASLNGQTEIMEFLISKNAIVNVADTDGWIPLHYAVSAGSLEAVKLLLSRGGDVEALTDINETAVDLTGVPEILRQLFMAKKAKYSSDKVRAIYDFGTDEAGSEELTFMTGDELTIKDRDCPDWWLAEADGKTGYVPRNRIQ